MMNRLCQTFEISINELLSGERISAEDLQDKSEENIKGLLKENESNQKNNYRNTILGIGILFFCLVLFGISLFGSDYSEMIRYVDGFSVLVVAGSLTALRLISRNVMTDSDGFLEHCVFPVGVIVSICNVVAMINIEKSSDWRNITVSLLPILYSSIIYIGIQCVKYYKSGRQSGFYEK